VHSCPLCQHTCIENAGAWKETMTTPVVFVSSKDHLVASLVPQNTQKKLKVLQIKQWPSPRRLSCHKLPTANVDGLPLQKSVKIANGFSLYFAILMGVRVHSSCFAYSVVPDYSLPGAQKLQSSWKWPWSNRDLSWKVISPFVSCCCGGLGLGLWGSHWLYACMFYVDPYECVATIVWG